jgi:hypothetical protein
MTIFTNVQNGQTFLNIRHQLLLVNLTPGFGDDDTSGDDKNMIDENTIDSLTSAESSTNNTITIPWLGPIKLPWNLTTLSQEVKNFEKSPVRVLLKVSNSTTVNHMPKS